MTDQELIQTAKQAMKDLWNSNDGKLMDYEQSAYNCLRLLCIRLEELTDMQKLVDHVNDTKAQYSEKTQQVLESLLKQYSK